MQRVQVALASGEVDVPRSLLAVVRLVHAAFHVRVAVRLMEGTDIVRRVHHDPDLPCLPDEPVVEAGAADRERRHVAEEPRREDEPVHRGGAAALAVLLRLADDEESLALGGYSADGLEQVGAEDDVGVDEAPQGEASGSVGQRERRVEPGRAVRGQLEAWHVLDAELAGRLRDVTQQQHLDVQRTPALHGAALERVQLAFERLRHGEQRQHSSS